MPLKEIVKRPVEKWKEWMMNDFEESVFPQFPAIREIKEDLYKQGAIYALHDRFRFVCFWIVRTKCHITQQYFWREDIYIPRNIKITTLIKTILERLNSASFFYAIFQKLQLNLYQTLIFFVHW